METLLNYQNILLKYFSPYFSLVLSFLPFALYIVVSLFGLYAIYQLIRLYLTIKQANTEYAFLELQPLKTTELSPYTTEQLFTVLHGLSRQQPFWLRFFNISKSYSFEIISTKESGINYLVRIPTDDSELVRKTLLSYLPGLNVKETHDYLEKLNNHKRITSYKLARHFAYPLSHQEALDKHDPIAYLTGSMTKLSDDDLISFQLVLSPLTKSQVPAISRISGMIYSGKSLVGNIEGDGVSLFGSVFFFLVKILLLPIGLLVFIFSNGREGPWIAISPIKDHKTPSPYQSELEKLIKHKLDQQLFKGSLRLLVASNNKAEIYKRTRGFNSALSSLTNANYQSLVPFLSLKSEFLQNLKQWLFEKRLLYPFTSTILSSTEAQICTTCHTPQLPRLKI